MIKIIESPQRSDKNKISWEVDGDILTVNLNFKEEVFDFTGLPEGVAEDIEIENLSMNPLSNVQKVGDEISVTILRFYNESEKEVFELG